MILIQHANTLVTMDKQRREITDAAILIEGREIINVGTTAEVNQWMLDNNRQARQIIDARRTVILPGLVNCHHHLYQTLTRSIGTAEGLSLFNWLETLYPIWAQMDSEAIYVSAKLGLTELILSGATTVADHLYLFPNDTRLDDEIRAAEELGV